MFQFRSRMTTTVLAMALACVAWGKEPASSSAHLRPSFRDADFSSIAQAVGDSTGRTVVVGSGVCAFVSAVWETAITEEQFYQEFVSIARTLGFTVVEQGSVTTITLDANAPKDPSCRRYPQADQV